MLSRLARSFSGPPKAWPLQHRARRHAGCVGGRARDAAVGGRYVPAGPSIAVHARPSMCVIVLTCSLGIFFESDPAGRIRGYTMDRYTKRATRHLKCRLSDSSRRRRLWQSQQLDLCRSTPISRNDEAVRYRREICEFWATNEGNADDRRRIPIIRRRRERRASTRYARYRAQLRSHLWARKECFRPAAVRPVLDSNSDAC